MSDIRTKTCASCHLPFGMHGGDEKKCPDGKGTFAFGIAPDVMEWVANHPKARTQDFIDFLLERERKARDAKKV